MRFDVRLCILWYLLKNFRTLPQNARNEDTESETFQTSACTLLHGDDDQYDSSYHHDNDQQLPVAKCTGGKVITQLIRASC